jgi:C4-dicarboxylate-specific signal transduction histidine kinase
MNNELDDSCSAVAARSARKTPPDASGPDMTPVFDGRASASLFGVDLHALRHVSRAIANDVAPAARVGALLDVAMQRTSATWGVMAILRDGGWEAAADASAADSSRIDAERPPIERLPVPILAAAAHLRDGLVLHDARTADQWRTDDYVRRRKPRAVICMPIRCNGALTGALYLEHGSAPGVFSPAQTAVVEIVALQAGFALENMRLRDELAALHARLSRTEAQMRDAQCEMERANRLKTYGELAASIVHEVAQPVTAIDTSARAGLKWLNRSAPNIDAAREMLAHICACAVRARTIVSALRAKARQEAPVFAVFDLADALREASEIVESTLDMMKVSLRVEGLSSPTPMHGDRVQLQQAVIGLLMNGAESMLGIPDGERVLVLSCERASNLLRIRIDDRGDGFDPALAERIFEPLFTTKPHGMGMGLSICKSIVDAHHGRLALTPRADGGTRATMTLPLLPM